MGYYLISKYQEQKKGTTGAAGRIMMPSGVQAITLDRRHSRSRDQPLLLEVLDLDPASDEPKRLLDPQLYLADISPENCGAVCARLVTYPWFSRVDPDKYDSGKLTQRQYQDQNEAKIGDLWRGLPADEAAVERAARSAVEYQRSLGCEEIILPAPLTDPSGSYDAELGWHDAGLKAAAAIAPSLRAYATVAMSDVSTFCQSPDKNLLLDVVLDQVSAREPGGVYLVLEQRVETGYYITWPHTIGTVLRLVSEFKEAGIPKVLVCWLGTAGLLALAAGADDWASGWYRSERRLKFEDLPDEGGGPAAAAFYSHRLAGEVHPNDLDRIRDAGALDLIEESTPSAAALFGALRAGQNVEDVLEWGAHEARAHFNTVMIRETAMLEHLTGDDRRQAITTWLTQATALAAKLSKLCGKDVHQRTSLKHQTAWLGAFQRWRDADHG